MLSWEITGFIAAFCTTAAFLPQALLTLKTRETHAISLGMYLLFTTGVALWLVYGIVLNNWIIIIANIITLGLALCILTIKVMNWKKDRAIDQAILAQSSREKE